MKQTPKKVAALLRQSPDGIARVEDVNVTALVRNLGALIDEARRQVATVADATLVRLHWQIGHRVHRGPAGKLSRRCRDNWNLGTAAVSTRSR